MRLPGHVVLGRFDVEVVQSQFGQTEFLDHRGGPEREVVAVADVDGRPGERLARGGPTDRRTRFEQQRATYRLVRGTPR